MATVNKFRTQAKIEVPSSDSESAVYELFDDIATLVITLSFPGGSGQAKIQTSTSLSDDLENDNAVWVDWSAGSVSTITQDSADAPNAIKVVNEGGTDVLVEVRGNYAG